MTLLTDPFASLATALAAAAAAALVFALVQPLLERGPPGPYPWPFVGILPQAFNYIREGRIHDYIDAAMARYGPIVRLRLFGQSMNIVSDVESSRRILNSSEFLREDYLHNATKDVFCYLLIVMPSGEMWKKHRKLLQPAFGPSHLRHVVQVSHQVVSEMADGWAKMAAASSDKATIVDVHKYFASLTLDVIGQVAFTHQFGGVRSMLSGKDNEGLKSFQALTRAAQLRVAIWPILWHVFGIARTSPFIVKTHQDALKSVMAVLSERKKELADNGGKCPRSSKDMEVLDRLLSTTDEGGERFTEEEIIGEIVGFIFAGHETTANTLSFIFLQLCTHPRVMAKLVAEIDEVYPTLGGELTIENMAHFKYLDCVIRESQRFNSVVGSVSRISTQPTEIHGYQFPAGSRFSVRIRSIHRNPLYWKDPDEFIPERFLEPIVPGSFLPFGDGPMNCIGQKMANIEMRAVLINLLRRFTFEYVEGQRLRYVTSITHGLKDGLKVRATERQH
ncbi:hypothetical protein HK105_200398 [Polyrhizophydium stewartii]|uniref:Cytochrome P450 n=1 Tax=Polyrhizophydium stewartii TaxID=2732419 RepID=A0ABR4NLD7_9FUNG|nr:Cytochrome P450 4d2 [Polyrhizophydium stewartii]